MTEFNDQLKWSLFALCRAGTFDEFSVGPECADVSRRYYGEAADRFESLVSEVDAA